MTKTYSLIALITTKKYFAINAASLDEAKAIAHDQVIKHLGSDFKSLEIIEDSIQQQKESSNGKHSQESK